MSNPQRLFHSRSLSKALERMKPFLEGKDLKQWRAESRNLYLILFPKGWTREQMEKKPLPDPPLIREGSKKEAAPSCSSPDKGRLGGVSSISEEMAWNWLKQHHPAICEWLEPFAVAGRKRGDKGEFWWELRSCGYYDAFQ